MIRRALRLVQRQLPLPVLDRPGWGEILRRDADAWAAARAAAQGPRILIATSTGGHDNAVIVESTLAVALTLRGARVHFLLCDGALPACMLCTRTRFRDNAQFVDEGPRHRICRACIAQGRGSLEPLGLPIHRYGQLITRADRDAARREAASVPLDQVAAYERDGIAIGEHAYAGALRYIVRGDFEQEPDADGVMRSYLEAAMLTARATGRLFDQEHFDHALFHHGIYVPQGIIGEVGRRRGVHVVNWQTSYRKRCFLFSHSRSYHFTMMEEPESVWAGFEWSEQHETEVLDYLNSRRHGARDWIRHHNKPVEDLDEIAAELGVDFTRPCVALLTNVVWDAVMHYRDNAFADPIEWVVETIRYFEKRPDLQLIIRVHPAEVVGTLRSRQPILDEIRKVFPELPANVFVIPPDSRIGTYTVADACDAAIIFGTKTGSELAAIGVPVIVAGQAWIRNKGFTLDAASPEEYFRLLDQLPLGNRMSSERVQRARQYAYHFFFRRMIPFSFMEPTGGTPPLRLAIDGLSDLAPGADAGLDLVCEGILEGSEFVYPAEHMPSAEPALAAPPGAEIGVPLHGRA